MKKQFKITLLSLSMLIVSMGLNAHNFIPGYTGSEVTKEGIRVLFPAYVGSQCMSTKNIGGSEHETLKLGTFVFITEEKEGWCHIYSDENLEGYYERYLFDLEKELELTGHAKDLGWVKKSCLLLVNEALTISGTYIHKKVLGTPSFKNKREFKRNISSVDKKIYSDSNLETTTGKSLTYTQKYFQYKVDYENSSVLIGTIPKLHSKNVSEYLLGWVGLNQVTTGLNYNIYCEPNWEVEAVQERKNNVQPVIGYDNLEGCIEQKKKSINWNDDTFDNRKDGYLKRWPVFDVNQDIIEVGVWGDLYARDNTDLFINVDTFASISGRFQELKKTQECINVIFVVDGTRGMQPYFRVVSDALESTMASIENTRAGWNLRFAAVAYTDVWEEDRLVQVKRLAAYREISQWLNSLEEFDRNNKDVPEAVYYGLITGIRATGIQKDETNLIVLIGDAGDHQRVNDRSFIEERHIQEGLKLFNCNLAVFQVNHKNHQAYDDFNTQMEDLIYSISENPARVNESLYSQMNMEYADAELVAQTENLRIVQNSPLWSSLYSCKTGESLSPDLLQNYIEELLLSFVSNYEYKLKKLENIIIKGGAFKKDNFQVGEESNLFGKINLLPSTIQFIDEIKISNDDLSVLVESNIQPLFRTFFKKKQYGLENHNLKNTVLVSGQMLGELLSGMDRLIDASTSYDSRQQIFNLALEILYISIGKQINTEDLRNLTYAELEKMRGQLPRHSCLLDYPLTTLTNPSIINDGELFMMIRVIAEKRQKLSKIYNEEIYRFRFVQDGQNYYWLPQNILP